MAQFKITKRSSNNKKTNNKPQKKQQPRRPAGNSAHMQLARLIADPCTAPLVAPQYGASDGGYLAKFSSHYGLDIGSVATSGYIIWYPDYVGAVGDGGSGKGGNVFMYGNTNPATGPTNSSTLALGLSSSPTASNGAFLGDPSRSFVQSSTVQDSRTVAACLKLLYTGRADALSGRIGYLESVPREALLTGESNAPPSPNALFQYSNTSMRTPSHVIENKFRPGEGSDLYRTSNLDPDTAFIQGTNGSVSTTISDASTSGVGSGIGFVWEGLAVDSSLSFDFLKAVEWRPEMAVGLVVPTSTVAPNGGNTVSKSLAFLDRAHPGWERRAFSAITGAVSSAASSAATQRMLTYGAEALMLAL